MGYSRTAYIATSFPFFRDKLNTLYWETSSFQLPGIWVKKCLAVRGTGGSVFEGLPYFTGFLFIAYFSWSPRMSSCLNCRSVHLSLPLFPYAVWAFTTVMYIKWKNSFLYHRTLFLRHLYGFIFWSSISTPLILALFSITASVFFSASLVFLCIFPTSHTFFLWYVDNIATSFYHAIWLQNKLLMVSKVHHLSSILLSAVLLAFPSFASQLFHRLRNRDVAVLGIESVHEDNISFPSKFWTQHKFGNRSMTYKFLWSTFYTPPFFPLTSVNVKVPSISWLRFT